MAQYGLETEEPILSPNPHDSGIPPSLDSRPDLLYESMLINDIFESDFGTDHFDSGIGPNDQDFGASEKSHEPLGFQKSGAKRFNYSGKKDQPYNVIQIIVPDGFPHVTADMETLIMKIMNL